MSDQTDIIQNKIDIWQKRLKAQKEIIQELKGLDSLVPKSILQNTIQRHKDASDYAKAFIEDLKDIQKQYRHDDSPVKNH